MGIPSAVEIEVLENEVSRLEERLAELVSRSEFQLGDRIVGMVSPRRPPRAWIEVPASLPDESRARFLRLKRRELGNLIELTQRGLRLELGSLVKRVEHRPSSLLGAPLELARISARRGRAFLADRLGSFFQPVELRPLREQEWSTPDPGDRFHVTVFADVDPNRIDGATIWLASVVEVLAEILSARVTVLLAASIRSPEVLAPLLDHARVQFIEPRLGSGERSLAPWASLLALEEIDRRRRQDLFLVRGSGVFRGLQLSDLLGFRPVVAARAWAYLVDPLAFEQTLRVWRLRRTARQVRGLLCQTPEAREYLEDLIGERPCAPIHLLPPMIPGVAAQAHAAPIGRSPKLVYAGKFSPPYRILDLLENFGTIRASLPGAELHVAGDRFHNRPESPGFEQRVRKGLSQQGVVWHGGLTRRDSLALIRRCDFAISWRDETFDSSLELATKVLEYAGCGVPVLLNPTAMHRRLFGGDYPGFIVTAHDLVDTITRLSSEPAVYEAAARHSLGVAGGFTFERTAQALGPVLGDISQGGMADD